MFSTECKTDFLGHQVVAHSSWGFSLKDIMGENKLYVDGKVVDTCAPTFVLSNTPVMRGSITDDGGKIHIVEVYARSGWTRVKLRIHIDGQKVAGEDF